MRHYDLTGQRFGRLTARRIAGKTSGGTMLWECDCDCGNMHIVRSGSLRSGDVSSCGCFKRDVVIQKNTIHGLRHTKIYKAWLKMKSRCLNASDSSYCNYGGRGITVCEEWINDFQVFHDWAMANGYREGLTIERIDNNGNYEPSNCRWATMKEQQNNKRTNRFVTVNGATHTLSEWSEIVGVNYHTLYCRGYRNGVRYEEVIASALKGDNNERMQ